VTSLSFLGLQCLCPEPIGSDLHWDVGWHDVLQVLDDESHDFVWQISVMDSRGALGEGSCNILLRSGYHHAFGWLVWILLYFTCSPGANVDSILVKLVLQALGDEVTEYLGASVSGMVRTWDNRGHI